MNQNCDPAMKFFDRLAGLPATIALFTKISGTSSVMPRVHD
jgi:hypothetical protein